MTKQILTQAQLKEVLHYCPDTGIFTWLKATGDRVRAGYVAGCPSTNSQTGKSYVSIGINKRQYRAHRLAVLYMTGITPEEVDHSDGDGLNNKWENLRISTRSDNSRNVRKSILNTSGCVGVVWRKDRCKWSSRIKKDGRTMYLGEYESIFDAACARKSAERMLGFHENHGQVRPL